MSEDNVRIVKEIYDAFGKGDLDGTLSRFHEDIEWVEPQGYFPSARGEHRGVDTVQRVLESYGDYWDSFEVKPDEYIDIGDGRVLVIARSEFQVKGSNETGSTRLVNLWTIRDGKAQRLEVFNDTALIWRALGGDPDYFA